MSKISCYVSMGEVPLHLYQITAGFLMLKNQGVIDLKIKNVKKNEKSKLPYNMLEATVNEKVKVLYDLNDGYDNLPETEYNYADFMDNLLKEYDFCFKRSYSKEYNEKLKQGHKIYPLGLNYMVTVPHNISHLPASCDPFKEKLKKVVRMLPFSQYYNRLYHVNSFENHPIRENNPTILFMARLWDSNGDNRNGISSNKQEERLYINEFRAKCIRLCKQEFGNKFFGGISPSPFANKYYSDIVIKDQKIVKRNYYLQKVKESSICIATMGLHESIGWKFAEYISASKAIVTERLHYEVPGNLKQGENYLVFQSPDECINQINRLLRNENLRYRIMVNNFHYYHQYVRPDRLVLNSLLTILDGGEQNETNLNRFYSYL